MAHNEQPAAQAIPKTLSAKREDAPRSGLLPLVGVIASAAFVANAWFFYHQGQRDGATHGNDAAPAPVSAPATPPDETGSGSPSTTRALPAETAMASTDITQPAAEREASSRSAINPDMVFVVKPAAHGKAKPANTLMAKAAKAKSGIATMREPGERQVALIDRPNPVYPAQALRTGEQGTVFVLAQVDVAGNVSDAHVVRHSGSYTLDRAAANEVRRWKFEPALHDGRPVVASVEVPVSYRLGQ